MAFAEGLAPALAQRGEEGVARHVGVDLGQLDPAGQGQGLGDDLGPADHRGLLAGEGEGCFETGGRLRPRSTPAGIAGEDDVAAAGEQARQRIEGLAAHDHRFPHGQRLEPPEVGRDVPGELAVRADRAVAGGGDDNERSGHQSRISRVTWPILRPGRAAALP